MGLQCDGERKGDNVGTQEGTWGGQCWGHGGVWETPTSVGSVMSGRRGDSPGSRRKDRW